MKFDYIFADPPYEKDLTAELVKRLVRAELLNPGGLMMLETAADSLDETKIPESVRERIESVKQYKFSKCYVYFVKMKEENR